MKTVSTLLVQLSFILVLLQFVAFSASTTKIYKFKGNLLKKFQALLFTIINLLNKIQSRMHLSSAHCQVAQPDRPGDQLQLSGDSVDV